jgi:hypothetical protein
MNIIKYRPELFNTEPTNTEKNVLPLFESKPLSSNITYFYTSWNTLINDNILHTVKHKKIQSGAFTVCDHIHYHKALDTMASVGVTTLFTSHLTNPAVSTITLLPFPQWPMRTSKPSDKNILYSFVGFVSHPIRRTILNIDHPSNTVIAERPAWYFEAKGHDVGDQYTITLAKSRFSLCPVGTGPSTIRFWESLVAGAIPVLISDAIRLPDFDWTNCIVKIPENRVEEIPEILNAISPDQEQTLREGCLRAADRFTGDNFVSVIRDHYANR